MTTRMFRVTATVSVDVEIEIEADSADEAQHIFGNGLALTASLVDVDAEKYYVIEDSIDDIRNMHTE